MSMKLDVSVTQASSRHEHNLSIHEWAIFLYLIAVVSTRPLGLLRIDMLLLAVGIVIAASLLVRHCHSGAISIRIGSDCAVLFLWLSEICSFAASSYRRNSFNALVTISLLTLVYILLSLIPYRLHMEYRVSVWIAILSLILSGIVIVTASGVIRIFNALRFEDYSVLKSATSRMYGTVNDWGTILLALLPFCILLTVIHQQTGKLVQCLGACSSALAGTAALLTLSRGTYAGLATFYAVLALIRYRSSNNPKRDLLRIVMLFGVSVLLASVIFGSFRFVFATVRVDGSTSQMRSVSGRFDLWRAALRMASENWFTGIGQNNFAMKYAPVVGSQSAGIFVGRPQNLLVQVVAERGALGCVIYVGVILLFLHALYKSITGCARDSEHQLYPILIAGILSLMVRELTYASLFSNRTASILFWILLINAQTRHRIMNDTVSRRPLAACFLVAMLALCSLVFLRMIPYSSAESNYRRALYDVEDGRLEEASKEIDLAIEKDKDNAYYIALKALVHGRTCGMTIKSMLPGERVSAATESEYRKALLAASLYQRALNLNSTDDAFLHNLGWLYTYSRDDKRAEAILRKAAGESTVDGVYQVSLGLFLERSGLRSEAWSEYVVALTTAPSLMSSRFFHDLNAREPEEAGRIVAMATEELYRTSAATEDPILQARLGALLVAQGHLEEAKRPLDDALRSLPNLARGWANLATVLRLTGNSSQAMLALDRAVFLDPSDPVVRAEASEQFWAWGHPINSYPVLSLRATSEHALRACRIYLCTKEIADDLLPNGLLSYCLPGAPQHTVLAQ